MNGSRTADFYKEASKKIANIIFRESYEKDAEKEERKGEQADE